MATKMILCCNCTHTPEYARSAYQTIFNTTVKNSPKPLQQKHYHEIMETYPSNSQFIRVARDLMKRSDKFAFYFSVSEEGNIEESWDLLKAKELSIKKWL